MRDAAQVVSRTLGEVAKLIKPGVTPLSLDKMAHDYILSQDAKPGFLGLYGCPSTLLISVNEQVVHGLPTEKPFEFKKVFRHLWPCSKFNLRNFNSSLSILNC